MKDQLLTHINGDDGRRPGSKFIKSLPNAHEFKVIIQGDDLPLLKHGIRKSVKSHLLIVKGENRRANRYLQHQLIRLRKLEGNYWDIVRLLCVRSKVWYVAHLQRSFPRWYRELPVWYTIYLWKKVIRIAFDADQRVKHFRVYIPKKYNNTGDVLVWRPLGVPTPEWRVYLSMLNTALTMWLEPFWISGQHAYFPGKGTITAWKEILSKIGSKQIYEFDLKQFFPSVEIQEVSNRLRKFGLPETAVQYFEGLNSSLPELLNTDLVNEDEIREKDETQTIWKEDKIIFDTLEESLIIEDEVPGIPDKEFEGLRMEMHAHREANKSFEVFAGSPTGLPQGGGISPVLSVQVLDVIFKHNPTTVMYADDGIIFDWPVLKSPFYAAAGIEFNLEKSGWVKRNGAWLKPLKFLGLIYDGKTDQLWSETRSNKRLYIKKDSLEKILADVWGYAGGKPTHTNVWVDLFNSRIDGLIQAMHYNGVYNLSSVWSDWNIATSKGSYMSTKVAKRFFRRRGVKPTLYNASSVSTQWLLRKLLDVNKPKKALSGAD